MKGRGSPSEALPHTSGNVLALPAWAPSWAACAALIFRSSFISFRASSFLLCLPWQGADTLPLKDHLTFVFVCHSVGLAYFGKNYLFFFIITSITISIIMFHSTAPAPPFFALLDLFSLPKSRRLQSSGFPS